MSEKTKQYIMNLDIEKDAKMLRDRLNICNEALAYFYASSSILKAGTKAGLNLYEIACLCCRNDNLGEIPSKLEVMIILAGDLAKSAIRNNRWGLAVASRAIQDQLSPHGGSLLTPPNPKGSFSRKAASAFDLAGLTRPKESKGIHDVPGMTQSAGTEDSSSYSDDGDNEDCEEWAAEIVNAVSLDTSSRFISKPRSPSIESDTSSEDGGFWQTSPNSEEDSWNGHDIESDTNEEDEESVSWSPSNSPLKETLGLSFIQESQLKGNFLPPMEPALCKAGSLQENFLIQASPTQVVPRMPVRVSFANIDNIDFDLNLKNENDDGNNSNEIVNDKVDSTPVAKMGRSRSYSALSSSSLSEEPAESETRRGQNISFTEDQYRDYYLKFVDLVVVREITAAAGARGLTE